MIVYFDTVRRKRPVREGGELVKVDWKTKEVLGTVPLYPVDPDIVDDPNPRGNSRGGKGILIAGDEVLAGTYHSIDVYDLDLVFKRRITNNLFVNLHEMCLAGSDIWVSSTTIDCALRVTDGGETVRSWWPREEPVLQGRWGFSPLAIDKNADNRVVHLHAELGQKAGHTHLNSVFCYGSAVYALLNRMGAIVQIEPSVRVVLEDPALKGAHSPAFCDDGATVALCCSFDRKIHFYDLAGGRQTSAADLLAFPEIEELHRRHPDEPFNKSIFVRGLDFLDERRLLVGISPAAVLEIDFREGRLLDWFPYSSNVGDAVHGIAHRIREP